jgi:hypothetical protein
MDPDRDAWCARFVEVLLVMDATVTKVDAEWTAQVVHSSAFNMTPVQAVWIYLGLNERRRKVREASSDAPS